MAYLHYLKCPSAEEFFTPQFLEMVQQKRDGFTIEYGSWTGTFTSSQAIQQQYQNWCNLEWNYVSVFAYPRYYEQAPHGDFRIAYRNATASKCGINWNLISPGTMEFWELENVDKEYSRLFQAPGLNGVECEVANYDVSKQADELYQLAPGTAHIQNVKLPHRSISQPGRICISIRSNHLNKYTWPQVLELFKDWIE